MGSFLDKPKVEKEMAHGSTNDFVCGYSSMQGFRSSMEDRHTFVTEIDITKDEDVESRITENEKIPALTELSISPKFSFFSVFDGHCGYRCAQSCSENLLNIFLKNERKRLHGEVSNKSENLKLFGDNFMLTESCLEMDQLFRKEVGDFDDSGTTFNGVFVCPHIEGMSSLLELVCVNVGDSRCVLYDQGKVIRMSKDHKPTLEEERTRIYGAKGTVQMNRVNGTLALSRAFGDFSFKGNDEISEREQAVIVVPSTQRVVIDKKEEKERKPNNYQFFICACDGIWDKLSDDEACSFVVDRLNEQEEDLEMYYNKRIERGKAFVQQYELEIEFKDVEERKTKGYDMEAITGELLDHCVESRDNLSAIIVVFSGNNKSIDEKKLE